MKRLLSVALLTCIFSLTLTACNSAATSTSSNAATSTAVSSTSVATASSSVSETTAATIDIETMVKSLTDAAGLGTTISMSDIDLKAIGINMDDVVAWAGVQSQLVAQNGGTVIVIQAKPGTADTMKATLEKYRDLLASDDRYQEYAEALENISNARIVVNGDCVVYAVSALGQEGGFDTLDTAIAALFS